MDSKNGGDHAELLQSLENVVMDLNDMENMIDNFEDDAAESFFTKVNDYVRDLKEVERLGPSCKLQVPREALERVDDDTEQNPEVFAQEILGRCKDQFGQLNARVQGINRVKNIVEEGWRKWRHGDVGTSRSRNESMPVEAHAIKTAAKPGAIRKGAPKSPAGSGRRMGVQGAVSFKR